MVFNDTTTKAGILQECEDWLFGGDYGVITGNTNRLYKFTNLCNRAVEEIDTEIMAVDERWQFDDTNYTDYPIATANLVAGQQDYQFDVSQIKILGVEILGADGVYYPLKPIDIHDIDKYGKGKAPTAYQSTNGKPLEYDVTANALFLYPAPAAADVTLSAGLKVYFQRAGELFVSSDTGKSPGFPSLFHELIAIKASNKFAKQNGMTEKARELDEIERKKIEKLREWYSNRHKENADAMTPFSENNR